MMITIIEYVFVVTHLSNEFAAIGHQRCKPLAPAIGLVNLLCLCGQVAHEVIKALLVLLEEGCHRPNRIIGVSESRANTVYTYVC